VDDVTTLRVGLVNENLSGHATFHRELLEGLRSQRSIEVRILDLPPRGLIRRALTSPYPLPRGWDCDFALLRNQIGHSVVARGGLRHLVKTVDVLHLYTQNACPLDTDILRKRPYVVTIDSTCAQASLKFPFRYPGHGTRMGIAVSSLVEHRLLSGASRIVAQSEWARAAVIADGRVPAERVEVIRAGAPRPEPVAPRERRATVRVVFVGASMTRKGGWQLLELMKSRLGNDVELHLVTRQVVAPRAGLVVHNDVQPNDGKIQRILADADIFALPTDMDMSPNAILEAMASGLPIVAYDSGAISEMVENGANGWVVPVHDIGLLGQAIDKLIASPSLREMFGRRSQEILATTFNPDTSSARLASVFHESAMGRGPRG
jgi:starch synthase